MAFQLTAARTTLPTTRISACTSRSARRSVYVTAKGNTGPGAGPLGQGNSDPQKVHEQKEKKHKEGLWAEPSNKNPLEKQTLTRQGIGGQSKALKDEQAVEKEEANQGYKKAASEGASKLGDAVDAVAGAASKAVDKVTGKDK